MTVDLAGVVKRALKDERKVFRPYFFPATGSEAAELTTEESYLRLRLLRMFLKHRRELFQTKYPVVNALMRFAGLSGKVEVNFVAKPELAGDGLDPKLGMHQELKENASLAPGYLVMIAAADETIDSDNLQVEDGELKTSRGDIYTDHDYLILAIDDSDQRSDWQYLGYDDLWQELLKTAADADDVQRVKESYTSFTGVIMASTDPSWADRSSIVTLAQNRIKAIREARASTDFLDGLKDVGAMLEIEGLVEAPAELPREREPVQSRETLMQTDWIS